MDFKGIDFKTYSLLPAQLLLEEKKEKPAVRRVKKGEKAALRSRNEGEKTSPTQTAKADATDQDAIYALEVMRDFLKDNPQLEVVLCSSQESELVIMVLEKESRRRISSLSISDIISGKVFDADGAFGTLFDKRV